VFGVHGVLVRCVVGVVVDHLAGFPAVEAHQVAFGATGLETGGAEGVAELVRGDACVVGLLGSAGQHLADAYVLEPSPVARGWA
jgi:hypothetical protein